MGLKFFWGVGRPGGSQWSMGGLGKLTVVVVVGPGRDGDVHVRLLTSVNCGLPSTV